MYRVIESPGSAAAFPGSSLRISVLFMSECRMDGLAKKKIECYLEAAVTPEVLISDAAVKNTTGYRDQAFTNPSIPKDLSP